jgi:uncharacterized membrane protein YphA (DoxX/SURF4 family)
VEVIASLLLILGWFNSLANILLIVIIMVAIVGVQLPAGFEPPLERDLQILLINLVLLAFGPGRYSLEGSSEEIG